MEHLLSMFATWYVRGAIDDPANEDSIVPFQYTSSQGAEQMGQMEHLLNVYASRSARNAS